ncbi:hypothetical protein DUNSADRAFT_4757 [Dunaliella salina]|uniref:Secreted protein n=1 Tax=Dunaliella salina TaxID=3046 RepID=A0ABQ7FVI0_DUNSA|nr:hypothetical protein DUNSADRAFT_4757 [Dunaliella salina]|eukprot:KAF5826122.1 hypothetical protein DUNSADRAFT_4757 [Dunaliella salina]
MWKLGPLAATAAAAAAAAAAQAAVVAAEFAAAGGGHPVAFGRAWTLVLPRSGGGWPAGPADGPPGPACPIDSSPGLAAWTANASAIPWGPQPPWRGPSRTAAGHHIEAPAPPLPT